MCSSAELRQHAEARNQLQAELDGAREELLIVKSDADSLRSMASVLESTGRDELESIRHHYEEELASLRHILEGDFNKWMRPFHLGGERGACKRMRYVRRVHGGTQPKMCKHIKQRVQDSIDITIAVHYCPFGY